MLQGDSQFGDIPEMSDWSQMDLDLPMPEDQEVHVKCARFIQINPALFQCSCLPMDLSTQCQGKKNENQINLSNHDGTPLNLSKQGQSSDPKKPKGDKSQKDSNANPFPNIFLKYKVEADAIITAMFKNVTEQMETITQVKERLNEKAVEDNRVSKGSYNMLAKYHNEVVPSMIKNVANHANMKEMVNEKATADRGKAQGSQDVILKDKSEADDVVISMLKNVTDNTKTITEVKERLNRKPVENNEKATESNDMFVKYNSETERVVTAMLTNVTDDTETILELKERLNSKPVENNEKATDMFVKYNNEANRVVTKMLTNVTDDTEATQRLNSKSVEDKLKANGFQDVFVKYQKEADALIAASYILPVKDHGKAIKFADLKRSLVTKAATIKHIDKIKQKPYDKGNAENVDGQQTNKLHELYKRHSFKGAYYPGRWS